MTQKTTHEDLEQRVKELEKEVFEGKQAEEALQKMSKIFMDATDPIIIEDLEGSIIDLNEGPSGPTGEVT